MFNTKITKQIISKIVAALAVFGLFAMYVPAFAANVSFNNTAQDCATVRVRNVTQNIPVNGVGPSGCDSLSAWTDSSVSANPGDLISVSIYYHNTGSDDAVGTRLRITSSENMSASNSHTITGVVSASNGGYASGSVTVNLTESQTLEFVSNDEVSGSTIWNDNANGGPYTVFNDEALFSQGVLANGNGIVSAASNGWPDQGALRLQFRVGSESTPDRPDVTTEHTSSEDLADVTLHGTIDNHNIGSLVWFELYDENMNFIDQTSQTPVNGGNSIQSFSDEVDGPFDEGEVYTYRACGMFYNEPNTYEDCGSYETFVIGQSPSDVEPVADTQNPDDVSDDSAELNGTVDMNDFNNGIVFFVYGQDEDDVSDVEFDYNEYSDANSNEVNDQFEVVLVDNDHDGDSSFTYDVNNLESDEEYFYQICVEFDNENGDEELECGGVENFFTDDESNNDDLDVHTFTPENVDNNSATLRGDIDEIGDESVFRFFEWGTNTSMTEELTVSGSTGSTGDFSRTLNGLEEDTTYYYRACAEEVNSGHTDCGVRRSFRTDDNGNGDSDITAITTDVSSVGRTSAVLNGLAVSSEVDIDQMWFEWGSSTGLNNETSKTSINASGTRSLARSISGLSTNTTYYYRVVAEDQNGDIAKGSVKFFRTDSEPTDPKVDPEPPVIEIVDGAGSLFLALDIEPDFENVIVGDTIDYTVKYRNISEAELEDVVIQVEFAEETRFIKSTAGFYSQPDHNLTVIVGDLDEDEEGSFVVRVEVLRGAAGDLIVAQANAGHEHPTLIDAQVGTVPAYAINNVVNDPNRLVGLALFGGAFFPTTFLGWLILLLVIIALVLLARKLYTDYDERSHRNINIQ